MNDLKWTYKTYKPDGSVNTTVTYWFEYATNLTCAQGEAAFNALSIAQRLAASVTVEPAPGADEVRRVRACSASNEETYVDATNEGYSGPGSGGGNPDPDPGPGPAPTGSTSALSANPAVFSPVVEWNNATPKRARISNGASPSIPSDRQVYCFVDGQSHRSALSTTYDYWAGDEVTIYYAIAGNPEPYLAPYDIKGFATVYIGNPPS